MGKSVSAVPGCCDLQNVNAVGPADVFQSEVNRTQSSIVAGRAWVIGMYAVMSFHNGHETTKVVNRSSRKT
jgi:hypothetical protein